MFDSPQVKMLCYNQTIAKRFPIHFPEEKLMKYAGQIITLMVFSLLFSVPVFGQEVKKQETASVAKAQEAKAAMKAIKIKRAVAAIGVDGIQRIEMIGGEYYYDPNYIVVQVNRTVELKIKKAPDSTFFVPHNIIVKAPEAGIDFNIDMSKEGQVIKFIPTKVGKYPMYCDKKAPFSKSHKEKGMEGMIEVVE
jgi:plastocyanin